MAKAKKKKSNTVKSKKKKVKKEVLVQTNEINIPQTMGDKVTQKFEGKYAQMGKAYTASAKILKAKMKKERAKDLELLDKAGDDSIAIVKGTYDKIEQVMDAIGLDYITLEPLAVGRIEFRDDQLLIINCPGQGFDKEGIDEIKRFVEIGGFLLTTDWALLHILEEAFPGYVKYNGKATGDAVVGIEVVDKSHPFLMGIFSDVSDPQWWLEGSSYPIVILNKKEVNVLVKSEELKKRWGEDPVVITFNYGKGTVMHMISHYYLQRSELRTDRHKKSATAYAKEEMALNESDLKMEDLEDVSLGEVESAYTSAQFISNIIVEKQKQNIAQDNAPLKVQKIKETKIKKTSKKKPKKSKKKSKK